MTKRTIAKIPISPGTPVRVEDFRYVDQGLEWNMQNEFDLRDDHLQASRVINWEVFNELALGLDGWTPGDSLEAEAEDLILSDGKAELYIDEGIAYIGGRGFLRDARNYIDDGTADPGSGATNYYIYLKYTESSNEFAFLITTSTQGDDHLIKYLLIATADWDATNGWSGVADKRASNTALGAPATVSGSDSGPIFTVENTGSGLGLLVRLSGAQIGEDGSGLAQILTIWGTSTTGLTLRESETANAIVLSCDASGRMKVAGTINVTGTGSIIASSATVGGVVLNAGAISSVTTLSMDNQLTNTLAIGTAPFVITSTTFVDNLNVDKWDSYDLNLTGAADNEIVIFDYSNSTLKTANYVIGNADGNVPVSNGTTCVNLKAANAVDAVNAEDSDKWDGYQFADYLDQAVKQASSPIFVGLTLSGPIATPTTIVTSSNITAGGYIQVNGNIIKSSTATAITFSGANVTTAGNLTVTGGDYKSTISNFNFHTSAGQQMQLAAATNLKPETDHGLDLGASLKAWDVVYRQSEQTTSFVGVFDDPVSIVKSVIWDENEHLIHTTLPESIRILRIKPETNQSKETAITKEDDTQIGGQFTGKTSISASGITQYEFISDEHYDVDGLAMLTLQALQVLIDHNEVLEARIEVLEAGS